MNIYFSYIIATHDRVFSGVYYGYTSVASHDGLLDAIFPNLQEYHHIQSVKDIILIVLLRYSINTFSNDDPLKYYFVYCNTSPTHFYFDGTQMK